MWELIGSAFDCADGIAGGVVAGHSASTVDTMYADSYPSGDEGGGDQGPRSQAARPIPSFLKSLYTIVTDNSIGMFI